jgi:hypothetical protein
MNREAVNQKLYDHIHQFFKGHKITRTTWNKGPISKALPDFCVFKITPGPKLGLWVYISSGAWRVEHKGSGQMEFMIFAPKDHERCVELVAMNAYYHRLECGRGETQMSQETQ